MDGEYWTHAPAAEVDVQLLETGELPRRGCVNAKGARFLAESYRQELLSTGWTE